MGDYQLAVNLTKTGWTFHQPEGDSLSAAVSGFDEFHYEVDDHKVGLLQIVWESSVNEEPKEHISARKDALPQSARGAVATKTVFDDICQVADRPSARGLYEVDLGRGVKIKYIVLVIEAKNYMYTLEISYRVGDTRHTRESRDICEKQMKLTADLLLHAFQPIEMRGKMQLWVTQDTVPQ